MAKLVFHLHQALVLLVSPQERVLTLHELIIEHLELVLSPDFLVLDGSAYHPLKFVDVLLVNLLEALGVSQGLLLVSQS